MESGQSLRTALEKQLQTSYLVEGDDDRSSKTFPHICHLVDLVLTWIKVTVFVL